ncbi:glycine-rich RNA-binding protein-like [Macadamia integrifolia]|uniref:glycine-rich RNA-binding protein-like n=1 Tax=Macadamia integrifolia TaxID=60698 RepID=UPI001C4E8B2B|nr:glycine-rich RNA-binding protein-like [Macadamia integrifolia]
MREAIEGMNGQSLDSHNINVNQAQNRGSSGGGALCSGGGGRYGGGGDGSSGGGYNRGGGCGYSHSGGSGYNHCGDRGGYGDGGSRYLGWRFLRWQLEELGFGSDVLGFDVV